MYCSRIEPDNNTKGGGEEGGCAEMIKVDSVSPFDPDDLVSHGLDVLKTLLVDQTVDQDEALAVPDVEVPHRGELLGAGRVQDLQHRRRRVHLDLLPVEIFDGRVVLLDEGPGDELDRQRGLPHPAAAEHHHLILPHSAPVERNPACRRGGEGGGEKRRSLRRRVRGENASPHAQQQQQQHRTHTTAMTRGGSPGD